jgi:hypothetical protein
MSSINRKLKFRLYPDWKLGENQSKKEGSVVRIHPYILIRFTQKKWGVEKACGLAIKLIQNKYQKMFDEVKL